MVYIAMGISNKVRMNRRACRVHATVCFCENYNLKELSLKTLLHRESLPSPNPNQLKPQHLILDFVGVEAINPRDFSHVTVDHDKKAL